MSTPPGWFPNPSNSDEEVYWDGDRWTGDTRPVYNAGGAQPPADDDHRSANGEALPAVSDSPGSPVAEGHTKSGWRKRRGLWIALAAVLVLLIAGGVSAVVVSNNVHAQQVADAKAATKKKADEKKAEEEAAASAAAVKQAADDAKRLQRQQTVTEVEGAIMKMAEDDVSKGVLNGPVLTVSCSPVSGSTDDLTDTTTTFDCFAANKDNGDGTQSGYFFNATVNWTSGQYTYGLGKSRG